MLSNARKAVLYDRMAKEVRGGWTKQSLQADDGRVCLVGAVLRVASTSESEEIEMDLTDELFRTSPFVKALAPHYIESRYERADDGGMSVLEAWNDVQWRRRSQVVKLLERQRDIHANIARLDRAEELESVIRGLRERIGVLDARVAELEAKNGRLEAENGLLRVLRSQFTAKQLVASSGELAELDAELDAAGRELAGLYVDNPVTSGVTSQS